MAASSQRLRIRHERTEMACAARRGKQNSQCQCPVVPFEICDQLRHKCRVAHCANRKGCGARECDLFESQGPVVEWTTVQLSVTMVGKWPVAA